MKAKDAKEFQTLIDLENARLDREAQSKRAAFSVEEIDLQSLEAALFDNAHFKGFVRNEEKVAVFDEILQKATALYRSCGWVLGRGAQRPNDQSRNACVWIDLDSVSMAGTQACRFLGALFAACDEAVIVRTERGGSERIRISLLVYDVWEGTSPLAPSKTQL